MTAARKYLPQDRRRIGQYEILKKLGGGGCGSVYQARLPATGALVAIKVLKAEVADDDRLLQRFLQEFAATRTLVSPHIVRALEFAQDGPLSYLVMEFVDGHDLWHHVTTRGRLPEAEAIAIIRQIAQALDLAHEQGIIHRDVKPDNILLTADGQAKLTDFGLVKDLDSKLNLTETATVLGTPNFMAPEQFQDPRAVNRRSDVYALAATLYMAVTGEVPFFSKGFLTTMKKKLKGELTPPRRFAKDLSPRAEKAILAALSVRPAERPATCLEFVNALTCQGETPTAPAEDRRTATRFGCSLESSCVPVGAERRTRWKAKVTDLSAFGVGLLLSRRFEPGTVLMLELQGEQLKAPCRLLARVVRVRKEGQRQWQMGCRLACKLSPLALQDLRTLAAGGKAVPFWLMRDQQAIAASGHTAATPA